MTDGCSAKVVERHVARQTKSPVVHETDPQRGRLAEPSNNPNSCLGQQPSAAQPVSARTGRGRQRRFREVDTMNAGQPCIGIDVSHTTLDVAVYPTREYWQVANDATGIAQLVERVVALAPHRVVLESTAAASRV